VWTREIREGLRGETVSLTVRVSDGRCAREEEYEEEREREREREREVRKRKHEEVTLSIAHHHPTIWARFRGPGYTLSHLVNIVSSSL
jgi:hypothetical protein